MGHGTTKPCHGCGGTNWRYATRLCEECAQLLTLGRAVKLNEKHQAEEANRTLYRLVPDWPHFMVREDAVRKELVAAFMDLTRRVLRPSRSRIKPYDKRVTPLPSEERGRTYYTTFYEKALTYEGSKATGKAIERLDEAVRDAIRSQYDQGLEDGGDLLRQLARGEITVAKLNEETMRGEV